MNVETAALGAIAWQVITSYQTILLLALSLADFVTGTALAVKRKTFRFEYIGQWVNADLFMLVGGYVFAAFLAQTVAAGYEIPTTGDAFNLVTFATAFLSIAGSVARNVRSFNDPIYDEDDGDALRFDADVATPPQPIPPDDV
jgi:hypothetical protein